MISAADRLRFREDGFVVLPGAIADAFHVPALASLVEWHRRLDADDEGLKIRDQAPDSYGQPYWREAFRVTDALANGLSGGGQSRRLSVQLIGSPGGQSSDPRARGWHLDTVEVARRDGLAASAPEFPQFDLIFGIYLTDMSRPDAGNLLVWPGSHLTIAARCGAERDIGSFIPRLYGELDLGDPFPVLARPGDLMVMNSFLAHDTSVNQSARFSGRAYLRYAHDGLDRVGAWKTGDPWQGWATV